MRVLIVDDVADAAQMLADGAKLVDCEQVDMVSSGEDAIGKVILEEYDLITLDLRMPGIGGLDVLSVVRGIRPHAIIAIISAYVKDIDSEALLAADVVLPKPVSLNTFQEVVRLTREICDRREAIRKLGDETGA